MVEDDGAVGPTVVVHQTQVREEADSHGLQTSLIAQSEAITLDLQGGGGGRGGGGSSD